MGTARGPSPCCVSNVNSMGDSPVCKRLLQASHCDWSKGADLGTGEFDTKVEGMKEGGDVRRGVLAV